MRYPAMTHVLVLWIACVILACMSALSGQTPLHLPPGRVSNPTLHQSAFYDSCQWIVSQDKVERVSGGRVSRFPFSREEAALDSLLLSDKDILVLTSIRLLRLSYKKRTLMADAVSLQGAGSLTYTMILCDAHDIWLYGGSSLHRIANGRCVSSMSLTDIPGPMAGRKYVSEPLFSDRLGSTFYFVALSRKGDWTYFVYDTQTSHWLTSRIAYDTPGPLVLHEGTVWQMSEEPSPVDFSAQLSPGCLKGEGRGSLRGLYIPQETGQIISQFKFHGRGPIYIGAWDLRDNVMRRARPLFSTQYSEPVSMHLIGQRLYYWPARMSVQEPTAYVMGVLN
jgi:hypothetical protein